MLDRVMLVKDRKRISVVRLVKVRFIYNNLFLCFCVSLFSQSVSTINGLQIVFIHQVKPQYRKFDDNLMVHTWGGKH